VVVPLPALAAPRTRDEPPSRSPPNGRRRARKARPKSPTLQRSPRRSPNLSSHERLRTAEGAGTGRSAARSTAAGKGSTRLMGEAYNFYQIHWRATPIEPCNPAARLQP
jgi:hypothetical protein